MLPLWAGSKVVKEESLVHTMTLRRTGHALAPVAENTETEFAGDPLEEPPVCVW